MKGEGFRTDEIIAFTDSAIVFAGGRVQFKEIERVSLKDKNGLISGMGLTLMVAGVGYFIIDQFNNSVIAGNSISTDDGVVKTSAIIAGTGALIFFVSRRNVNTTKNWRIRHVNIY